MNVKDQVVHCAKKLKADFICLSTHGAGKIQQLFGTHASDLIINSPIPVITVPKKYRVKPIKNLFYASDFAALTKELQIVRDFATPLKAKMNIYHYDYLLHVAENRKRLEGKADKLKSPIRRSFSKKQDIELPLSKQLLSDIRKTKPSMVILFTKRNRNWYDRFFFASESTDLAFHAITPLLTFRKKADN